MTSTTGVAMTMVILKVEPRVLADVLDVEGEGKRNQE